MYFLSTLTEPCKTYEMRKFSLDYLWAFKNEAFVCHILITAILTFARIWNTFMVLFNLVEKTVRNPADKIT